MFGSETSGSLTPDSIDFQSRTDPSPNISEPNMSDTEQSPQTTTRRTLWERILPRIPFPPTWGLNPVEDRRTLLDLLSPEEWVLLGTRIGAGITLGVSGMESDHPGQFVGQFVPNDRSNTNSDPHPSDSTAPNHSNSQTTPTNSSGSHPSDSTAPNHSNSQTTPTNSSGSSSSSSSNGSSGSSGPHNGTTSHPQHHTGSNPNNTTARSDRYLTLYRVSPIITAGVAIAIRRLLIGRGCR